MPFVLDKHKKPLAPCSAKRAKQLLKDGKAIVHKQYPFTIRMKEVLVDNCKVQPLCLKIDPGSKTTGLAIALLNEKNPAILQPKFLAELTHHGSKISEDLSSRSGYRRGRRSRNLPYRAARF